MNLKHPFLIIFACNLLHHLDAQNLYNNVPFAVKGSATLYISNSFTNESSATYLNDATVTINGDISNKQASMSKGIGVINITGSTTQNLTGTQPFVVNNVVINNTSAGSSNFVFSNDLTVGNSATFTDGIVVTNTNKITFLNNTTYSGASNTSHVNGFVEKFGNQAFTFPVGDGTLLRTASISAPTLATDVFVGKYFHTNPNPLFNLSLKDPVLDSISTCEYWTIDRTAGSSNVPVTLTWQVPNSSCISLTPSDLYVARWDGSLWQSHGNGGTTGNSTAGTIITSTTPTAYGPFTLAKRNIPLPITLVYFNGKITEEGNLVTWKTSLEVNSQAFSIEKSCDGHQWKPIGTIPSNKNTNRTSTYSLLDQNPCDGINYYKLVEYSMNGVRKEYSVIDLDNLTNQNVNFQLFPNPNNGSFSVLVSIKGGLMLEMEMINILGQIMGKYNLVNGLNSIECSNLANGVYLSEFKVGKNKITKKIIINQ